MLEEEVLDTHKLVMDNTTKFLNDAHSVFSATHEVDYDQEGKINLFAFARLRLRFFIGFSLPLLFLVLRCTEQYTLVKKNEIFSMYSAVSHLFAEAHYLFF